ncbi:MAG: hypothetical protein B7X49_17400 [Acidiphilium sp. 34-64-41]|nr:MAG: hypothetical protein B7X49_17400 [Acidiphilium sp. 34-64-41]
MMPNDADIFTRLISDERMSAVWKTLQARKRPVRQYLYPAIQPPHAPPTDAEGRQAAALAETFLFALTAARDGVRVSKPDESERRRQEILQQATIFSDSAKFLPPQDAETFARATAQWTAAANNIRGADDPLTVSNDRGDRLARGVQIIIAVFLLDRFGNRLDGTAATLTAVALGLKSSEVSVRVSRSAFSGR